MKKRILSFVIVLIMTLGFMPTLSFADTSTSGTCGENLTWSFDEATGTLTIDGTGVMSDFNNTVNGMVGRDMPWYSFKDNIISVIIGNGVTSIGDKAFFYHRNLVSVAVPDTVTSIGTSAFYDCYNLSNIKIPEGVTSIDYGTFYNCGLESINIPNSVTLISGEAFYSCDRLDKVYITDINAWCKIKFFDASSNPLANSELYLNNAIVTSLEIPNTVTTINDYAFIGCESITSVKIPDSVISIGDGTFCICENLESVTMFNGVTSIGDDTFWGCSSLASVTIPSSVTSIGASAFENCSNLTTVNYAGSEIDRAGIEILSYNQELLNATWIYDCIIPPPEPELPATSGTCGDNLTWSFDKATSTLTIDGTGEMGNYALGYVIDGGVQPWDDYKENIKTVIIEDGVTSLGNAAFAECSNLENVTIANSVTSIGEGAFAMCEKLKNIAIPNGVTAIKRMTFMDCSNLETVTIPNTVTTIGAYAFDGCSSLKNITIPDSVTTIADSAFSRCIGLMDSKGFIIVKNILFSYEGTDTEVIIPDGVKVINGWCFAALENIVSVTIPKSVTTIGACAFNRSLATVNYRGSQTDRANITIEEFENEPLLNATWVYNYGAHTHSYTNACDTTCDCGYVRTTTHSFGGYVYNGDASEKADGTKTRVCSVCGHKETVTATGTKWKSSFTDIKVKDFYYKPTLWAVANGITTGTSKTEFSPEEPCTRGQVVTFLWRAAGCPEPRTTTMPFTDVGSKAFYKKAVLWAVEQGITSGTSATTFSPNETCTRGQIATFLWRAKGKPAPKSSNMPFVDVKSKDFYYKAVLWAVENKITSGTTKTTFAPSEPCTRGQIVTFLYRAYN